MHGWPGRSIARLAESHPLVLSVMGGAVVFSRAVVAPARFPAGFRLPARHRAMAMTTQGGHLHWKVMPQENVRGGSCWCWTIFWTKARPWRRSGTSVLELGAASRFTAPYSPTREPAEANPSSADFVGMDLPNRYRVRLRHGCARGMAQSARNLCIKGRVIKC